MWSFKRQFWGIVLIILGGLALVQMAGYNLGLRFWPVLLLVTGAGIMWSGLRRTSWFSLALGVWLGGIGLFDILNGAGLTTITGGHIAAAAWPLLLVAVGVGMLFGRNRWTKFVHMRMSPEGHIVGDLRYGNSNWLLDKDLNLEHGIGDVKLDLTTANITPGVHNIKVGAWIGEIFVRVPDNVTVYVDAATNIGELDVLGDRRDGLSLGLSRQVVVADSPTELHIDARLAIGSLRIVQRPSTQRFVP
ncbi:MAG TPA: LiaF domain-containing protein [Symbiobacteriaceae bacterium]|jgi:lia operon protein LiaF